MKLTFISYIIIFFIFWDVRILSISLHLFRNPNQISKNFHPFRIEFDYYQLERDKDIEYVNYLKNILEKTKEFFSKFIYIKNNGLLKTSLLPKSFCDSRIQYYNESIKEGLDIDFLIYPILFNVTNSKILLSSKICAEEFNNKRPLIASLMINNNFKFEDIEEEGEENKDEYYYLQIIHHITHIIGFNKDTLSKVNIFRNRALRLDIFKNLNEKSFNSWSPVSLEQQKNNYALIKQDIMSKKSNERIPVFSSLTLSILQSTKFYQINLSLCGCSLDGNCEYFRHPISISFQQNLNEDLNHYCYLNKNIHSKCHIMNNTFVPRIIPKKVNHNQYNNYLNGNHSLNKLLFWESTIPNIDMPQIINLLYPKEDGKCKNPQRTLFFYYPDKLNVSNSELKDYKIEPYTIYNKDMIVYHTYMKLNDRYSFYELMDFNGIPFSNNYFLSNFLSYNFNVEKVEEVIGSLGKYQVYNNIVNSKYLYANKAVFFKSYRKIKNKFPNDFNFYPESYVLPEDKEIVKEKFSDYKQNENDLWLFKPPTGSLGLGIKLLKNFDDFLKSSFISKYITNPLLLNEKKFHIRLYVIVTGVLPLKIYIFDKGQIMQASSKYHYDLEHIGQATSMLTNNHQNFKKPGFNNNVTFDGEEGSEWTISTLGKFIERRGGNWTKMWEEIKDISIKAIMICYGEIQKNILENYTHLRSNNLFHRYGFDVMIDNDLKPWLLEINTKPAMELYNIINVYNKILVEADRINLIGMVPFNHYTQEPLDKEMIYKDKVDEAIQHTICEFERPHGGLERIFPVKKTLNYYKQFIEYHDEYNKALWNLIENNEI